MLIAAFGFSVVTTFAPGLLPADSREVYYEAVGVILTLILLGRLLETKAKAGTGEAIRALIGLQPRTARVVRGGLELELPVDQVVVGDTVVIRPGEKLPVDGQVSSGSKGSTASWLEPESNQTSRMSRSRSNSMPPHDGHARPAGTNSSSGRSYHASAP